MILNSNAMTVNGDTNLSELDSKNDFDSKHKDNLEKIWGKRND